MKYCNNCGAEVASNSKFCNECGERLSDDNSNNIKTGRESVNFIATGSSKIRTRDVYINPHKDSFEIEYEEYPFGKEINVSTIEKLNRFTTISSIISSIITMITFCLPISIASINLPGFIKVIILIVTAASCLLWSKSDKLLKGESLQLPSNIKLRKVNDKNISRIEIVGECPICKGTVVVNKVREKDKEKYIGICGNNSEHIFTFDNTIFKGERIK